MFWNKNSWNQFIWYCCTFHSQNIPHSGVSSFFAVHYISSSVCDVCRFRSRVRISLLCGEIITSNTEIINNDRNGSIVHVFLCHWTNNRKRNKLIRSFRFCFPTIRFVSYAGFELLEPIMWFGSLKHFLWILSCVRNRFVELLTSFVVLSIGSWDCRWD